MSVKLQEKIHREWLDSNRTRNVPIQFQYTLNDGPEEVFTLSRHPQPGPGRGFWLMNWGMRMLPFSVKNSNGVLESIKVYSIIREAAAFGEFTEVWYTRWRME
jgi:hypothetical protein